MTGETEAIVGRLAHTLMLTWGDERVIVRDAVLETLIAFGALMGEADDYEAGYFFWPGARLYLRSEGMATIETVGDHSPDLIERCMGLGVPFEVVDGGKTTPFHDNGKPLNGVQMEARRAEIAALLDREFARVRAGRRKPGGEGEAGETEDQFIGRVTNEALALIWETTFARADHPNRLAGVAAVVAEMVAVKVAAAYVQMGGEPAVLDRMFQGAKERLPDMLEQCEEMARSELDGRA